VAGRVPPILTKMKEISQVLPRVSGFRADFMPSFTAINLYLPGCYAKTWLTNIPAETV
jgi:hypothetical protein